MREEERLNANTQKSKETFERASHHLSGGVASSYQLREPWPIYMESRHRPEGLGRRRQRDVGLPQRFRLDGAGPRQPADRRGRPGALPAGHPLRRSDRGRDRGRRRPRRPLGLPKWRYTNSGSEATMDAIRIARGHTGRDHVMKIFGSYHGHHDTVMVSIGVEYDQIGDHENLASLPYGAGIPQVDRRPGRRGSVQRRRCDGAPHHPDEGSRSPARLRDHGGGDDEPRRDPARGRLPRRGARDHRPPRRRPDLRRGQDRHRDRPRRRGREVRRRARHGHPGQGARRRLPGRRDRRHARRSWPASRTARSTRSAPTTATRSAWPPPGPTSSRS